MNPKKNTKGLDLLLTGTVALILIIVVLTLIAAVFWPTPTSDITAFDPEE